MSVIDNLGFVRKASFFPCGSPDPILALQAAGSAIGPVLLSAGTFGCLDIIKMRAGISPWHSRGIRTMINGVVSPAEADKINKIYKFVIPLEKALFFWFVVDLTTEFAARWQSQLFKLGACPGENITCTWGGPIEAWVGTGPDLYWPCSYRATSHTGGCPNWGGSRFIVPKNWFWSCYFSIQPKAIFAGQVVGNVQTRLQRVLPFFSSTHVQNTPAPWFGNQITAAYLIEGQNEIGTETEYEMQAATDVPAVAIGGTCVVTMSPRPFYSDRILPTNCFGQTPPHLLEQ